MDKHEEYTEILNKIYNIYHMLSFMIRLSCYQLWFQWTKCGWKVVEKYIQLIGLCACSPLPFPRKKVRYGTAKIVIRSEGEQQLPVGCDMRLFAIDVWCCGESSKSLV